MLARNGISECELLRLVPMAWCDWLMLFEALQHSSIVITRMGLVLFANEQVSYSSDSVRFCNHLKLPYIISGPVSTLCHMILI